MKNYLKKRLGKVIQHFKNAVFQKGACRVCGDWWTDLSKKTVGFQNTTITQQSKIEEKKIELRGTSIYPIP